ncbi:hypothetical protein GC163_03835 [bacterium]|nr:hypothetical protein [bacterium]
MNHRWMSVLVVTTLASLALPEHSVAQPPSTAARGTPRQTVINVELLAGADGGALHSQAWAKLFEDWDVSLVVRRGLVDDKPDLSEKTVGTLRYVTLVGKLDRTGQVEFPNRKYTRAQQRELKEWIDELRTYGIQGTPEGKPLWGLSKPQFEDVFQAISTPLTVPVEGLTLPEAIEKLELPAKYPLRWTTEAEAPFRKLGANSTVRQEVAGFSRATALAILLNDRGFGFRPGRTPQGTLELVVQPIADDPLEQWPVGWPPQRQVPQLVPGMFVMTNIEFEKAPASEILEIAAGLSETPIFVDFAGLDQQQIDLTKVQVQQPLKKTTWSLALRYLLVPQKLNREYWQDEGGRGFVWITPIGRRPRPAVQP